MGSDTVRNYEDVKISGLGEIQFTGEKPDAFHFTSLIIIEA